MGAGPGQIPRIPQARRVQETQIFATGPATSLVSASVLPQNEQDRPPGWGEGWSAPPPSGWGPRPSTGVTPTPKVGGGDHHAWRRAPGRWGAGAAGDKTPG